MMHYISKHLGKWGIRDGKSKGKESSRIKE